MFDCKERLVDFVFLSGDPKDGEVLKRRKQDSTIQKEILSKYVEDLSDGLNDDQYDAGDGGLCIRRGGVEINSISEAL